MFSKFEHDQRVSYVPNFCSFYIKIKLKYQIFNDKKSLSTKMFFSVITKTLNREILTKYLATFKRWDDIKNEKF